MSDDSDDDFERFLQQDDSASMSSASPVMKKKATTKKASASKSTTSKSAKSKSSTNDKRSSGGSLSVVAAAEKLLAVSGRSKPKSKPIVEAEVDESDDAPPPYSDDPYAFELGATSYYGEENEQSDDDRRGKGKAKAKKEKEKEKEKEVKKEKRSSVAMAAKKEFKPTKTLEERMAEILKRTGGTTYPSEATAAPADDKSDGYEEEKRSHSEEDNDNDFDAKAADSGRNHRQQAESSTARQSSKRATHEAAERDESDKSGADDPLSFSDSLGMESADFEVGLHAKRKLDRDRSRLSLSSLHSEKFAVNMDALEDSEQAPQSRYDRQSNLLQVSFDTSAAADSEYGDDGFELDQTTDFIGAAPSITAASSTGGGQELPSSSFMSEFDKMKSLFSLGSPVKQAKEYDDEEERPASDPTGAATGGATVLSEPPPESDTFGYDEDDFETDEVKEQPMSEGNEIHELDPHDEYGDDQFDEDERDKNDDSSYPQTDEVPAAAWNTKDVIEYASGEQNPSYSAGPTVVEATAVAVVVVEPSPQPQQPVERVMPTVTSQPSPPPPPSQLKPPTPPLSPPPPPPPNEEELDRLDQDAIELPPRTKAADTRVPQRNLHSVANSSDRFRSIEHQVASLRFLSDSSRKSGRSPIRSEQQRPYNGKENEEQQKQQPFVPASSVVDDAAMAEEMEEIEKLVDHARRVRQERKRSALVRSSAKESELALRLQQAQRQLLQFKHHVQELADDKEDDDDRKYRHDPAVASTDAPSPMPSPVREDDHESADKNKAGEQINGLLRENDLLKKEVATQERLIQGFQRENEQLMKQLKQVQRDLHYDVHQENESLRNQLRERRKQQLDGTTAEPIASSLAGMAMEGDTTKSQYRGAIEARLRAEAVAVAASLQEDLNTQAKRHQERVNELKIECEKVKKAKIEMECRYEGIDLERMENESRQIKLLQEKIHVQKTEHDHAMAALQNKIEWYVANQRLLDEQDDKVKALKDEIQMLKEQAANGAMGLGKTPAAGVAARSPGPPLSKGGNSTAHRSMADVRKIQELETRLSEMEEAMRRRHPDSLVSLMVSSRKAAEASTVQELKDENERRLNEMREEIERSEEENEKKLLSFRQQQEKLMLQYQKQIADLEKQLSSSNKENQRVQGGARAGAGRPLKKNPSALLADETELHRVRRFYAEKIKEVERKWEAKYRSVKKQQYAAAGFTGGAPPSPSDHHEELSTPVDTARVIRALHLQIKKQEDELSKLRLANGSCTAGTSGGIAARDLQRRVASLETQLKASEDARHHLVETISSLHAFDSSSSAAAVANPSPKPSRHDRDQEELTSSSMLRAAQQDHEIQVKKYRDCITSLEQQLADQSTTGHALHTQLAGHVHEVERLQKLLAEAEREKKRLADATECRAALESEVSMLRDQMASPQAPSMLQFRSLELRIETLTQKHQLREAELQILLAQATQSSQLEKLNYDRRFGNAIALKNAEILQFKKQLEEILDELETLRQRPSSSSSSSP